MGTYILVTKMTPEVSGDLKMRETVGKEWKKKVDELCPDVKWIAHYSLLGQYDFMDIYEADSDETAAKVSMITRSGGTLTAETWPAMPWKKYIEITKDI